MGPAVSHSAPPHYATRPTYQGAIFPACTAMRLGRYCRPTALAPHQLTSRPPPRVPLITGPHPPFHFATVAIKGMGHHHCPCFPLALSSHQGSCKALTFAPTMCPPPATGVRPPRWDLIRVPPPSPFSVSSTLPCDSSSIGRPPSLFSPPMRYRTCCCPPEHHHCQGTPPHQIVFTASTLPRHSVEHLLPQPFPAPPLQHSRACGEY
jgi:hypothetical protein